MSLKITVGNDTVEQEYSYDLKPHTWNALDMDLAGLLIKTEGKINRINLSCVPRGRTLYLDHIYFCEESEGEGEEPSEPEEPVGPTVAAPTPLQAESRVVSVFSDVYANIPYSFDSQEGQTTKVDVVKIAGNNTWKLTNTNSLFINLDNLKVDHLEQLHLDVWTPDAEIFSIYLSDGVLETPAIKMASIEQRWNALDILLSDYQKYINMANLYSIRLESNKPTIF